MPDYAALQQKRTELIRKALDGSWFLAPISSEAIEFITGPDSMLLALPVGYNDYGWTTEDGMQFGRDMGNSEIRSFGSTDATRSDIQSDTDTVNVVGQETSRITIETYLGVDLESLVPEVGGEVAVAKPTRPKARFHRGFSLAVDDADEGEIYIGRTMPRVKVTSYTEQQYGSGDSAITWGATFTAYKDSTLGYASKYHFGGPGWAALLDSMGFQPAATA